MMARALLAGLALTGVAHAQTAGETPAGAQTTGQPPVHAPGAIGAPAGSGPYPAIAEALADAPGYTIYRPAQMPRERLPLVLWGNGGCRDNGLSASHFLREIASHGYLVVANGAARLENPPRDAVPATNNPATPRARTPDETQVSQMLAAIDWAKAADGKGPLRGKIDTARVAVLGHSCGGLQALSAAADPRVKAVMAFGSGVYNRPNSGLSGVHIGKDDLKRLHTPVAYVIGGPTDIAYPNASDDFARITHVPVLFANLPVGHGGTIMRPNGGGWAKVGWKWLDWQLKGSAEAGRYFIGEDCGLCREPDWTVDRKNFPEKP